MKKKKYFVLAAVVFALTMIIMNASAVLLSVSVVLVGIAVTGGNGASDSAEFLMGHLNLYTCLIYVITGSVFLIWYYFAFTGSGGTHRYLKYRTRKIRMSTFGYLFLLTLAVQHAVSLLLALAVFWLPASMESYSEMIEMSGISDYSPAWVFATLILPPLVEETIFRGLIFEYLKKAGLHFWAANLIQALLFGVFHMNIIQGIYAFCLGLLLGYLVQRYDSILIPMIMHAMFNFCGTFLSELESQILPEFLTGIFILISIPVTFLLLTVIHRTTAEENRIERGGQGKEQEEK